MVSQDRGGVYWSATKQRQLIDIVVAHAKSWWLGASHDPCMIHWHCARVSTSSPAYKAGTYGTA